MIKKIEDSYLKSKIEPNDHYKSLHWDKIIKKKNFGNLNDLKNFRNNGLSYGHDDSNYYDKKKFDYEIDLIIKKTGYNFFFQNIKNNNIGNLKNLFNFNNLSIDPGDIHLINFFYELNKYVFNRVNVNNICEIGGGYGGLAEKIVSKKNCKYILIDLPETNILSTYYLYKNFPEKKFLVYSDIYNDEISKNEVDQNDIIILPPNVNFKEIKIELFINTRSMMEMKMSIINNYFQLINNHISEGGFFFNVNRYIKFRAGEPIFLKDYPYDQNWKLINSSKSFNQDWIHQLITQRKKNYETTEVKIELERISKETKKYLQHDEVRYLDKNYFKKNSGFIYIIRRFFYIISKVVFGKKYYKYKQLFYKFMNKLKE